MQSGMDRCGRVKFKAALCKNEKERYIAIDDLNNVILDVSILESLNSAGFKL
jgi:hypothetical protein